MSRELNSSEVLSLKFLTAFATIATIGVWVNLLFYSWFAGPLRWSYPNDTFLAIQVSRFSDFYDMVYLNRDLDPYNTRHLPAPPPPHYSATPYPPLTNVFFHVLSKFDIDYGGTSTDGPSKAQDGALWVFLGFPFLAFPLITYFWLRTSTPWLTILLVTVAFNLSYPMLIAIDRGNLELYSFICLTIFAWLANSDSTIGRFIAIVAVAVAGALKIYPLVFILIFLKRRQYSAAVGAIGICGLLTLLSYAVFKGTVAENISANYRLIRELSAMTSAQIVWATRFSSSLFSLVFLSLKGLFHNERAASWFAIHYDGFLKAFSSVSLLFIALRRLSFARLFTAVSCLAILGTSESPDYKLLLLLPATIAIIVEGGGQRTFNLLFVAIVGLLLVPKNWVMIFDEVSYGSIADPLLVLSLFALVLAAPTGKGVQSEVLEH